MKESIPTEELTERYGISPELVEAIQNWDDEFQEIYVPDDPLSSEFATEEEERDWSERGREIARRISAELGADITVEFSPGGGGTETIHKRPADSDETS